MGIILESEIANINPNSQVSHSALSTKGVRIEKLSTFLSRATDYLIVKLDQQINDVQHTSVVSLSYHYSGTPYDLMGAIGLGFNANWQDDDSFWCSEWVAFVFKAIGMNLPYLNDIHRITPMHNLQWKHSVIKKVGK